VAKEVETDPYEHTKSKTFLNPVAIKALVTPISFEALRWKYYGQVPSGSVQIICETKFENLLKLADKIKIDDKYFHCWKDDSKNFVIMKKQDYLLVVLARKS
jgi:hypothetical protein